ncbi:MAG: YtxH domain-containing protein [Anaerolineales bacterium]|jgi:gas vesicle protein
MDYEERKTFFSGLLIGTLAGAIISGVSALLLAPHSGKTTRKLIRTKGEALRSDAEHRVKDAIQDVEESLDRANEAFANWIDKGNQAVKTLRKPSAMAGRVAEKVLKK